jgi:ATP-dependent Lhr-like helicase
MSGVFSRLAPFIQEYIYAHNWTELRDIQVEACKVIFETDLHLLLASGTASGKTEAAFLPVLTDITENKCDSIAVLYIAPIKALINDQFERLNDLLKEADIKVWHWHGDVSPTHKRNMINNPSGILQITPESLESMLINKANELTRLFGDLRYIIIDEVHSFMGQDRGLQILCQLERLKRFLPSRCNPRRIGLSATLGDYAAAEHWLASGTDRGVITPPVYASGQKIRLAAEHFYEPQEPEDEETETENPVSETVFETPDYIKSTAYWEYLYEKTLDKKCIIFTNLRNDAEAVISMLRQIAELRGKPDVYHVHHGSISASLREGAEFEMKESAGPVVVSATLTLEMGIDVGRLESIFQINAPYSVSSFLQRLGRSGRRGNAAEMWFLCREERPSGVPLPPAQIPWRLLQTISVIQLYLDRRWVETPRRLYYPLNLLYHQTMSVITSMGEIEPSALAKIMLNMSPFRHIGEDDYRILLNHLINIQHLQLLEDGGIIIGLAGEKIVNSFKFYAVFAEEEEFSVMAESRQIGKIEKSPPVGERLTLAGRTWEVLEVDPKRKTVFVRMIRGRVKTYWAGGNFKTDVEIIANIKNLLTEERVYPYLQKGARTRLSEARYLTKNAGIDKYNIVSLGGRTVCIFPWAGSIEFCTILMLLRKFMAHRIDIKSLGGFRPYYIICKLTDGSCEDLLRDFRDLLHRDIDLLSVLSDDEVLELKRGYDYKPPKYDEFIPVYLQKKALIADYIDLASLSQSVDGWVCTDDT